MRSVLYIVGDYLPKENAGTIIIRDICKKMRDSGIDIAVYSCRCGKTQSTCDVIDGVPVFRGLENKKGLVRWFAQALTFLPSIFNCSSVLMALCNFLIALSRIQSVTSIIEKRKPDVIVSVCWPFYTHQLASMVAHKTGCSWFAQYLDPYYNNQQYHVLKRSFLQRYEYAVLKRADRIMMPSCNLFEYRNIDRNERLTTVEYPKISFAPKNDSNGFCSMMDDQEVLSHHRIQCIYLGSFYKDVRDPSCVFSFFKQLVQSTAADLVCIGRRDNFPHSYFAKWQLEIGDALKLINPIPAQEAAMAARQADILISIGNLYENQFASKTIEYVNTGKPILHFYKTERCPSKRFLEDYPLAFCIKDKNVYENNDIEAFLKFCELSIGKNVNSEYIVAKYGSYMLEYVVNTIIQEVDYVCQRKSV